jgi:hypothetical protein
MIQFTFQLISQGKNMNVRNTQNFIISGLLREGGDYITQYQVIYPPEHSLLEAV